MSANNWNMTAALFLFREMHQDANLNTPYKKTTFLSSTANTY